MADEVLVQKALDKRLITAEQLAQAQQRQAELADRGLDRSVWLILQDVGALDPERARDLERRSSSDGLMALEVEGYVVQGRIGKGGMGDVFLGQKADGTQAAVKMLPARLVRDQEYLGRFQREAEALSRLKHPNITGFVGRGAVGGRPYLIMELVRGPSLKEHLTAHGAIDETEARVLLKQIAEALSASWEIAGLVHRDIKPANILLAPSEDPDLPFFAKLCDFGLAKFQGRTDYTVSISHGGLTHSGVAIGTPHYMSPEQATGDRSVDQRHDIYGLGATVYHALLGKTLYSGGSSAVIMYKQATAVLDIKPLAKTGISQALVALIEGMLAKPRENRITDWATILQKLKELPEHQSGARRKKVLDFGVAKELAKARDSERLSVAAPAAPSAPSRPTGRLALLPLVLVTTAVVCIGAGVLFSQFGGNEPVIATRTDPAGLTAALDAYGKNPVGAKLNLAAGTYAGPWRLGPEHRGLTLIAEPGAVLESGTAATAIEVAAGAEGIVIAELTIRAGDGLALRSAAAGLTLRGCRIERCGQAVQLDTGRLVLEDVRLLAATSGVHVAAGAELSMRGCLLVTESAPLVVQDASITVRDSRLVQVAVTGASAVRMQGGTLTLDGVLIETVGDATGVELSGVGLAQLLDTAIQGGRTGMRLRDTPLDPLRGVSIVVSGTGIHCEGQPPVTTAWSTLRIDAARAAEGMQGAMLPVGSMGADEARISALPARP